MVDIKAGRNGFIGRVRHDLLSTAVPILKNTLPHPTCLRQFPECTAHQVARLLVIKSLEALLALVFDSGEGSQFLRYLTHQFIVLLDFFKVDGSSRIL